MKMNRWWVAIGWIALMFSVSGAASSVSMPGGGRVAESASILGYSERPGAGNSYIHFLRAVMVSTQQGRVLTLFATYEGEDQFFPATGSRYSIVYEDRKCGAYGGPCPHSDRVPIGEAL
jgi:hypothetical protein